MGLIPVLLLGEIDLSAGVTGGMAAGFTAVAIDRHDQALARRGPHRARRRGAGRLSSSALLVAKLGIPSFVVTLAFFLGLQGVTLKLIGLGGTIPVRDDVLRGITIKSMPVVMGWIVVIALLALYGGLMFWRQSRLAAKNLHRPPNSLLDRSSSSALVRGPARDDRACSARTAAGCRPSSSRASPTPCSSSARC